MIDEQHHPVLDDVTTREHAPAHPGDVLRDYIPRAGCTITQFARHIGVSRGHVSRILHGHASLTPDCAIRLSRALGHSITFWLNMQRDFDVWRAYNDNREEYEGIERLALS